MADEAKPTPDLKVVKPEPDAGADLLALGASAMAKAKEEIRAEVQKEIIKGMIISGILTYLAIEGPTLPRWARRLLG